MGFRGQGWSAEVERPGLWLRLRAYLAWRAYRKAEQRYRPLQREMACLEADREALSRVQIQLMRQGVDESELDRISAHLDRINGRFMELGEPWREAHTAMESAYASVQRVLGDLGFRERADGDGEGESR